jgi:hypothetical protein
MTLGDTVSPERPEFKDSKIEHRNMRTRAAYGSVAVVLALTGCGDGEAKTTSPSQAAAEAYTGEDANPGAQWQDQTGNQIPQAEEIAAPPKGPTPGARIVETALHYAWPSGEHGNSKNGARNNYGTELYTVLGVKDQGSDDSDPWSDCGVFVAFVMHKSGVDPQYPKRETNVQIKYLQRMSDAANPNRKYDKIDVKDPSQLQPGDILIFSRVYNDKGDNNPSNDDKEGHTYLFTGNPGPDGKKGNSDDINAVSAAWTRHVPQRTGVSLRQSGRNGNTNYFSVFRFINRT